MSFRGGALAIAFFLSVILMGGWLYSRTTLFRVSEISVVTDDSEIQRSSQERLVSLLGQSLFSISISEIQNRLSDLKRIHEVSITRVWPQSLKIYLKLKKSFAKAKRGAHYWSLDEQGNFIEKISASVGLLELRGFLNEDHQKWNLSDLQKEKFFAFLRSRAKDESVPLQFNEAHFVEWSKTHGLVYHWSENSLEVLLGFDYFEESWSRFLRVWPEVKSRLSQIESIDATYQNRVIARTRRELQNSEYRLNLEELVRRGEREELPKTR
jgi:cell division septal protein FtsQ